MARVPFTHVIPPKRHHAIPAPDPRAHLRDSEEVLAELTKLGCLNPLAVERQRERGAMLERLEGRIGVAVGSLWACWGQHSGTWCAIWWRRWKQVTGVAAVQTEAEEAAARQAMAERGNSEEAPEAAPLPAGED